MKLGDIHDILEDCSYRDYEFQAWSSGTQAFIYATYEEPDTVTGLPDIQETRSWVIDLSTTTKDQVVSTAFLCVLTSMEHRAREWFLYKQAPIYQPHQGVDALLAITAKRVQQ